MWELDCEESWAPKNWCFWTVVLEKTLESPLGCKTIQPVHPGGDQSWVFIGRTDVEAETPILWPPDAKSWLIWKDPNDKGRDAWMASPTQWMWVWVDSSSWRWTGRPGVLWFMGSQRVGHDWVTELNWTDGSSIFSFLRNYQTASLNSILWYSCCPCTIWSFSLFLGSHSFPSVSQCGIWTPMSWPCLPPWPHFPHHTVTGNSMIPKDLRFRTSSYFWPPCFYLCYSLPCNARLPFVTERTPQIIRTTWGSSVKILLNTDSSNISLASFKLGFNFSLRTVLLVGYSMTLCAYLSPSSCNVTSHETDLLICLSFSLDCELLGNKDYILFSHLYLVFYFINFCWTKLHETYHTPSYFLLESFA